ncbi:hypothetical protein C8A01DRAFT_19774 [Parachaetomium inaequale]|uniref:Uncharacterized protein n=1 Tax=Parachaetomium inaequale TaxID=2588326 RepID=A0AAN6P7P7_9PEZI|nr:hypothetical protein C8A01DRAFT_19774 [Parachaetomium inaequale]
MHCAQELFSLFILAIAAEVSSVGGTTSPLPPQGGKYRVWDNTLLTSLAEQAVRTKLAANIDEALTLVVPAFAHYNLLPKTDPVEQPACSEGEHTDAGVDERDGSDSDDGSDGGAWINGDD